MFKTLLKTSQPSKNHAACKRLGLIQGFLHQSESEDHNIKDEIKRYFFVQVDINTDIISF